MLQTFGARTQEQVQRISDQMHDSSTQMLTAVGQVSNQVHTVEMLTTAVAYGIEQMQGNLQQQTLVMQCVMKHCENIRAGQSEMIAKQEEVMDKLNSIDAKVDAIYMSIMASMQTQPMKQTLHVVDMLAHQMDDHLKHPRKPKFLCMP